MIVSTVYGLYHRRKIEAMEKVKETGMCFIRLEQVEAYHLFMKF